MGNDVSKLKATVMSGNKKTTFAILYKRDEEVIDTQSVGRKEVV